PAGGHPQQYLASPGSRYRDVLDDQPGFACVEHCGLHSTPPPPLTRCPHICHRNPNTVSELPRHGTHFGEIPHNPAPASPLLRRADMHPPDRRSLRHLEFRPRFHGRHTASPAFTEPRPPYPLLLWVHLPPGGARPV